MKFFYLPAAARVAILTLAVAGGVVTSARADFSGDYALTPPARGVYHPGDDDPASEALGTWTLSELNYGYEGSNFNDMDAPASFTIDTGIDPIDASIIDFGLSNTARSNGHLSFTYTYLLTTDFAGASASYSINGNGVSLVPGTHAVDVAISYGDTFDFDLNSAFGADATLTISDFSVPEPGAATWFIAGTGGLLGLRAARRRLRRSI